jgi:hypothetical protein
MSSTWTILDANGTQQSVADWGLCALTRELVNQMPDIVTFRAENTPSDAAPVFAYGSTIQLFRDGVPWFQGRVIQVPGRATGKLEEQLYRVAGPWWYLENLVFQQTWQVTNGSTLTLVPTNKSRLVLSQAPDGTKFSTGAAIGEVLAYATARGVPITVGTITPNATVPYAESLDRSCAEVIRNFLRWAPDAMVAFDYTTTPYPTLSIHLRADAPVISLPAYGAPVSALELTPRYDLQVPAVVLKFEQTNDIDGDTFTSLIVQSAPTTATGDEFGALVMTFDLSGARATYHHQPVVTTPLPQSDTDPIVIPWWQTKFAWLNDFDASDLSVVSGTQSAVIDDPAEFPDLTTADVPNELQHGSISAWMNLNAAPLLVSATLQYSGTATPESGEVFDANNQRVVYTRVMGTNADTGTYSRLTSETDAEPVPEGMAAAIYAATGVLQYDGTLELTEQECSGAAVPGQLLNLTGGRADWTTMQAQVQRVEESIDLGQTKIIVGPAKHLGQTQITAWLRANRERRLSYRLSERTTGSGSGNAAKVQGGEHTPRSDSIFRPSAGGAPALNKPFQILDASNATGLQVQVNVNSFLQQSLTPNDLFTITGLGNVMAAPVGTQIWLEIDFDPDSGNVTAATINSGTGGWSGFPTPFVYSGTYPNQELTTTFLLIGYIAAANSPLDGTVINGGPPDASVSGKIIQCVTMDVLLQNVAFNGLPAVFPFPHHAPSV